MEALTGEIVGLRLLAREFFELEAPAGEIVELELEALAGEVVELDALT